MKFLKENKITITSLIIITLLRLFLVDTSIGKYVDIASSVLNSIILFDSYYSYILSWKKKTWHLNKHLKINYYN